MNKTHISAAIFATILMPIVHADYQDTSFDSTSSGADNGEFSVGQRMHFRA